MLLLYVLSERSASAEAERTWPEFDGSIQSAAAARHGRSTFQWGLCLRLVSLYFNSFKIIYWRSGTQEENSMISKAFSSLYSSITGSHRMGMLKWAMSVCACPTWFLMNIKYDLGMTQSFHYFDIQDGWLEAILLLKKHIYFSWLGTGSLFKLQKHKKRVALQLLTSKGEALKKTF